MELSIVDIISLIIAFVSILFAVFLLTIKTKNYTSNLLIALFLMTNAQDSASQYVGMFIYPNFPGWGMFINCTIWFNAPLLYLYILSVVYSDFKLKLSHLWHAVPFLIMILVLVPRYFGVGFDEKINFLEQSRVERMPEIKFSYIFLHAQASIYFLACFIVIKKYKNLLLENFSNASLFNYKWLFQLITILTIEFVIASVKNVFMFLKIEDAFYYTLVLTSVVALVFTCWVVLKALRSPELFNGINSTLQLVKNIAKKEIQPEQFETNNITHVDVQTKEKIEQLKRHMIDNQPFLDASLTINKLAKQLNTPTRELSLLINHTLNQHFFDFINEYRVKKAMEILRDPNKKEFTVLEILYEVGFNSKSSFNTVFKKYTGQTPTLYRTKHSFSQT